MEGLSQQIAHEGDLSESPTATPYQTRSSSPIHGSSVAHTKVEGSAAMVGIWSIWRSRQSSHAAVSVVDGSATVPAMTKFKYLAVYFAFNLAVTLYNKAVMIQVGARGSGFKFEVALLVACYTVSIMIPFCSFTFDTVLVPPLCREHDNWHLMYIWKVPPILF